MGTYAGTYVDDNWVADWALTSSARFLDVVFTGWRVPVVAGLAALIVWDVIASLTYRHNLRLPFIVLYLARLSTPKETWQVSFKHWKAELWHTLTRTDRLWASRFAMGMIFAVPLALGGARHTARADAEGVPRKRFRVAQQLFRRSNRLVAYLVTALIAAPGAALATWLQWSTADSNYWLSVVLAIGVSLAWTTVMGYVLRRITRVTVETEETER